MGKGTDAFWRQIGKNSGNAVFNALGINHGSRVRVDRFSEATEKFADILAAKTEADLEKRNYYNHVDAAVNNNIDEIAEMELSNNPEELDVQMSHLAVLLNSNDWHIGLDKENKIRNKYTKAVVTKMGLAVGKMLSLNPNNPNIKEYFVSHRVAKISVIKTYWPLLILFIIGVFVGVLYIFDQTIPLEKTLSMGIAIVSTAIVTFFIFLLSIGNRWIVSLLTKPDKIIAEAKFTWTGNISVEKKKVQNDAKLIEEDEEELPSVPSHPILERGFCRCRNEEQKDILVVGFNPSFPKGSNPDCIYYDLDISENAKGYWKDVRKMFVSDGMDLSKKVAYIDLFDFRETDQNTCMREIITNPSYLDFIVTEVVDCQDIIEDVVKPKLIIVKNQAAWAFFGYHPTFTWMGYDFTLLENLEAGALMRINGFKNKKDRINQARKSSNLVGTKILFTTHTNTDKYPTPEEIDRIL